MKKEELKPCPFCGGKAYAWRTDQGLWYADCKENDFSKCIVQPGTIDPLPSEQEAIEAWNRRAI